MENPKVYEPEPEPGPEPAPGTEGPPKVKKDDAPVGG